MDSRSLHGRSTIDWSESIPRYLLVEEALTGRRVLEVGAADPRSLIRLAEAGAAAVVGTTEHPDQFDAERLRGRPIEVVEMEAGRLDFRDGSFDAILVGDLAKELQLSAEFLHQVRRILTPEGFCVLGFCGVGRSLVELIEDGGKVLDYEPAEIEHSIREVFPDPRIYRQVPFVGVAIQPEEVDGEDGDVSLDPSMAGAAARPSHFIALCGAAPKAGYRTLVELPFLDFEAMAEAAQARAAGHLERVSEALEETRRHLDERDRSLALIRDKLPRLRAAIELKSKKSALGSGVPSPTLLDRPTSEAPILSSEPPSPPTLIEPAPTMVPFPTNDTIIEPASEANVELQVLREAVAARDSQLDRLRARAMRAQQEASELREELNRAENRTMIGGAAETAHLEREIHTLRERETEATRRREMAERQSESLRAQLDRARRSRDETGRGSEQDAELHEAQRRILHLEHTASTQEAELDRLHRELESQLLVRHSIGSNYRDAEARIQFLTERLEQQSLEAAKAETEAQARISFLTAALSDSDRVREEKAHQARAFEAEVEDLRSRSETSERSQDLSVQELNAEREVMADLRSALDRARVEAMQRSGEVDALRRRVADLDHELASLKSARVGVAVDRQAVELAATHLSKELETQRTRVQALRNERDTLAATARLLLEERDAAAELAKRAVQSDERAQRLATSLEGGQAAIERLERELDTADQARVNLEQKYLSEYEEKKKLVVALQQAQDKLRALEDDDSSSRSRVGALDQQLAALQRTVAAEASQRQRLEDRYGDLEESYFDACRVAGAAQRDVLVWQDRCEALERAAAEHEQAFGAVLAERAWAEAALVEMTSAKVAVDGRIADLTAQLRHATSDTTEQKRLEREKTDLKKALSQVLAEAGAIDTQLREAQRDVADQVVAAKRGEAERLQIERQRQAAERARGAAEKAGAALTRELQVLRERNAQLEYERNTVMRDFAALEGQYKQATDHQEADKAVAAEIGDLRADVLAFKRLAWEAEEREEAAAVMRATLNARVEDQRTENMALHDALEAAEMERALLTSALEAARAAAAEQALERSESETRPIFAMPARPMLREVAAPSFEFSRTDDAERVALRAELSSVEEENAWLRAQNGTGDGIGLKTELRAARDETDFLRTRLNEGEQRLAELKRRVVELSGHIVHLEAERRVLTMQKGTQAQAAEHVEALEAQLEQTGASMRELERRLTLASEQLRAFEADAEQSSHLEEQLRASESQVDELREALERVSLRAESFQQAGARVEADLAETRDRLRRVEELSEHRLEKLRNAQERAVRVEQRVADLEQAARRPATRDADTKIMRLQHQLLERDDEIGRIMAQLDKRATELDEARAEVGRKLAEIRVVKEDLSKAAARLSVQAGDAQQLRERLARQGDAERLTEDLDKRSQENARLRAELSAAGAERSRLQAILQDSEQTLVRTERRVAELEVSVAEQKRRAELLERELQSERQRRRGN